MLVFNYLIKEQTDTIRMIQPRDKQEFLLVDGIVKIRENIQNEIQKLIPPEDKVISVISRTTDRFQWQKYIAIIYDGDIYKVEKYNNKTKELKILYTTKVEITARQKQKELFNS